MYIKLPGKYYSILYFMQDKFLRLVLDSMSDIHLWHCYFKDFVNFKLCLISLDCKYQEDTQSELAQNILSIHFKYLDKFESTHRVAELHITYQLQVAKMVTILRPLSKCKVSIMRATFTNSLDAVYSDNPTPYQLSRE